MPAMTHTLINKLIDAYWRQQGFTFPTSVFIALVTSAPTASTPGTEVSTIGTGYARIEIECSLLDMSGTQADGSTAASSGTSGVTSNNAPVDFGTATLDWGTIVGAEVWTAVTGGERHFYGSIVDGAGAPLPRSVIAGDPVSFPAAAMRFKMG